MVSDPQSTPPEAIGAFEYEMTDEVAYQATVVLFERQVEQVKQSMAANGIASPAAPLAFALGIVALGQLAVIIWAWDFFLTPFLLVASVACELLLLFKIALYTHRPFANWYIGRMVRRYLRRMNPRTIRWTFFEDRLETWSAIMQRSIPWDEVMKVNVRQEFWFLDLKNKTPLVAPAAVLSEDLRRLIALKARQAGADLQA
jgi:hypothetical protein